MALGATLALLTLPMFPAGARDYVGKGQELVLQAARRLTGNAVPFLLNEPPVIETHSLEELVHRLVNVERAWFEMDPLAHDKALAGVALSDSEDMATSDFFAHINPAGEGPSDRGARQGYNCRKDYDGFYTEGLAENIFQNWLYSSVLYIGGEWKNWQSVDEIAVSTVEGWMDSPGHVLTDTFDRQGIGVAISSDEKVYVTQNFC